MLPSTPTNSSSPLWLVPDWVGIRGDPQVQPRSRLAVRPRWRSTSPGSLERREQRPSPSELGILDWVLHRPTSLERARLRQAQQRGRDLRRGQQPPLLSPRPSLGQPWCGLLSTSCAPVVLRSPDPGPGFETPQHRIPGFVHRLKPFLCTPLGSHLRLLEQDSSNRHPLDVRGFPHSSKVQNLNPRVILQDSTPEIPIPRIWCLLTGYQSRTAPNPCCETNCQI